MRINFPIGIYELNKVDQDFLFQQGIRLIDCIQTDAGIVYQYETPTLESAKLLEDYLLGCENGIAGRLLLKEDSWDAPFVARVIKENGMPTDDGVRALLIKRFRSRNSKQCIPIGYEDLCAYAEPFNKTCGMWRIPKICEKIGIRSSVNLNKIVEDAYTNGKLTAEEAELILYTFPCIGQPIRRLTPDLISFAEDIFG